MRVLVFGTYDVRAHPRVAVLIEGLVSHGADLEECNVPLGIDTAGRVAILHRPWRLPLLALRLVRCWIALVRCARRKRRPDVVLVGYLGHFDVLLAHRLFREVPIVLDHLVGAADTARDRGADGGLTHWSLARLDSAALGSADLVVVDTEDHLRTLPERHQEKGVVVPVGATRTWFCSPRREPGPLRVVFFGLYTPLQGACVIGEALGLLSGAAIQFTMIGTGQDRTAAQAAAAGNDHVRWLDWVPADELAAVVAAHDVCLGIFGVTPKAARVVPTKVFQGAAAGCAIVTSDTPPQRSLLGDAARFVQPGDARALADTLRSLAAERAAVRSLADAAQTLARERFAPHAAVDPLVDRLAALGLPLTNEEPLP